MKKKDLPELAQDFLNANLPDEYLAEFIATLPPEAISSRHIKLDDIADRLRTVPVDCVSNEAIADFTRKLTESKAIRKSKIKPAKVKQFAHIILERT